MRASEARRIAEHAYPIYDILEAIKKAARNKKFTITWFEILSDEQIKELKKLGYEVTTTDYDDINDISW